MKLLGPDLEIIDHFADFDTKEDDKLIGYNRTNRDITILEAVRCAAGITLSSSTSYDKYINSLNL